MPHSIALLSASALSHHSLSLAAFITNTAESNYRYTQQIAADQAKNGAARLAGVEAPRYEDNETTMDQLKARLSKTIAFLKTLDPKQIDASADRQMTFPLGPTNKGHMKGDDYLNHFVLPNFYFHLTAAYAILRHCGVEIGKRDFLGAIPMKMTYKAGTPWRPKSFRAIFRYRTSPLQIADYTCDRYDVRI
jgi:uncharacterized protein